MIQNKKFKKLVTMQQIKLLWEFNRDYFTFLLQVNSTFLNEIFLNILNIVVAQLRSSNPVLK